MGRIPWWALGSAGATPVLLVGGWTMAAALQPAAYDPIRDTISALASQGARDRWVMTAALVGVGAGYIVTAVGLHRARMVGRAVLAGGGVATMVVALSPQPVHGTSVRHVAAATVGFMALAAWPIVVSSPDAPGPLLKRPMSVAATLVLLGLVVWLGLELHGDQRGLAERAVAGAEAMWPLAVALTAWRLPISPARLPSPSRGAGRHPADVAP